MSKCRTEGEIAHFRFASLEYNAIMTTHHQHRLEHILEILATATDSRVRQSALIFAIDVWDHPDSKHQVHITIESMTLVLRCLQKEYCVTCTGTRIDHKVCGSIVDLHIQLLILMFQCCEQTSVQAVEGIGTELLILLVAFLCAGATKTKILLLIEHISRLTNITMSAFIHVESLVRLLQCMIRDKNDSSCLPLVGLQLLCGWAENPENEEFIWIHTNLWDDVHATVTRQQQLVTSRVDTKVLFHAATFVSYMSRKNQRKPAVVRKTDFLKLMVFLLHQESATSIAASLALGNLATEAVCRVAICKFGKGVILQSLVAKISEPGSNVVFHQTLFRLIGQQTVSSLLKNVPSIVEQLALVNERSLSPDASVLVARCLKRLSSFVKINNKLYPNVIDALVTLSSTADSKVRYWAAKGLCDQSRSDTSRFYITRDSKVLGAILRLARDDTNAAIKTVASEAMLTLASDAMNAKRLTESSGVLEVFIHNARSSCPETSLSVRCSIQAIVSIVSHKAANRNRVAKTLDLVATLSEYGTSKDVDQPLKNAALKCVIVLAPFL